MSAPMHVTVIVLVFLLVFAVAGLLFAELSREEDERRHWWREND